MGKFLSLAEAALQLRTSRDYLNVLIHRGKLRGIKLGRNWVTTKEWVDEYLANKNPEERIQQLILRLEEMKRRLQSETNPIARLNALSEAFANAVTADPPEEVIAPSIPYLVTPLHEERVFVLATNPGISRHVPGRRFSIARAYLLVSASVFGFLLLQGVASNAAEVNIRHALAELPAPVTIEGDYINFHVPRISLHLEERMANLINLPEEIAEVAGAVIHQTNQARSPDGGGP